MARVVAANPQPVADYRAGKAAALSFLVGQVMKDTRGRANPALVNRLLREALAPRRLAPRLALAGDSCASRPAARAALCSSRHKRALTKPWRLCYNPCGPFRTSHCPGPRLRPD